MKSLRGKEIIDRVAITQNIETYIKNHLSGKNCLCLYGHSGVGKSSIMNRVIIDLESIVSIVKVIAPLTKNGEVSINGKGLTKIARAINDYSHGYKFTDYMKTPGATTKMLSRSLKKSSTAMEFVKETVVQAVEDCNILDTTFFNPNIDDIQVLKNYIVAGIREKNLILYLSDAENVDSDSFEWLSCIVDELSEVCIIMEFNTDNPEDVQWTSNISDDMSFELWKIPDLDCTYMREILGADEKYRDEDITKQYNALKGNLFSLIELFNDSKDREGLSAQINGLDNPIQFVLMIICLCNSEIEESELETIIYCTSSEYYVPEDWKEKLEKLIDIENRVVSLKHASIIEAIDLSKDNKVALAAYTHLKHFYEKALDNKDTKDKAVIQLFRLYSIFSIEDIPVFLEEFRKIVISSVSQESAACVIKKAYKVVSGQNSRPMQLSIIRLCYDIGLYEEALILLNQLGTPLQCDAEYALLCMLLNRNDRHIDAVKMCNEHLKTCKGNRAKLIFSLIQMISERSLNQKKLYKRTYRKIKRNRQYRNCLEYGFFLRNSQIVLQYKKSIPYLKKSIDFFVVRNEQLYANYTRLTLVIQQARLGIFENVQDQLEQIKEALIGTTFERHIIFLNEAAVQLLQDNIDGKTYMLLEKALATVTTTFDRIIVFNDILCYYIATGVPQEQFNQLKQKLDKCLSLEPDKKVTKKAYTNYALYYKYVINDDSKYNYWKKEALSQPGLGSTIENCVLNETKPKPDYKFLASKQFCVSFITYWHFPIPEVLE